jgi:hypothetical protein
MKPTRNPLLGLPAMAEILALPAPNRAAIAALLKDLAKDANRRAEQAWRKRKGPMAAYWRATSTYAIHASRAIRHGAPPPAPLPATSSTTTEQPTL